MRATCSAWTRSASESEAPWEDSSTVSSRTSQAIIVANVPASTSSLSWLTAILMSFNMGDSTPLHTTPPPPCQATVVEGVD